MKTGLQRLRHRPRRWLALWAAFALLFNQIALAQHLCLYPAGRLAPAAVLVDVEVVDADCHGAVAATSALADAVACAVHCDDGDKQPRDVPSLKVPDLGAASSEVAQLQSTDDGIGVVAVAEMPRPAQSRRTTDFGVLLI